MNPMNPARSLFACLALVLAGFTVVGCADPDDLVSEEEEMGSTDSAISGGICRDYRVAETRSTRVKLRSAPAASAAALWTLEPDTQVTILTFRPTNNFYKVYAGPFHSRVEGWIWGPALEVDCP